ncbi:MAG: HNH endonuclease [Acidobacteria bacterium]|nr:HNH endonuclease [Acidobacteriota bacterium]
MRRVIDTRHSIEIGKCIYCGTIEGGLSEEHVTPFGLGGQLVLLHASCKRCAKITSSLETTLL